jgi:predicted CoA-substrate-specific enzyme activase
MNREPETAWIGIDVGSTTAKLVVVNPAALSDPQVLFIRAAHYTRHNARQAETVHTLLSRVISDFPAVRFRAAVCGSGGKTIADVLQVPYIQEVVANSIAIKTFYPQTRVAIELGGQDAKIVFFYFDKATNRLMASDMRMNGSCAGGTGAFIDEAAALLKIPVEEFESCAARGSFVYDISGRCGVFAKTDIQPLLNQGVRREDIALSTLHAIARQTIGGLAQGLELKPPIIFEGGPLTFNPSLIQVFAQRLGLTEADIIRPRNPETLVACGAALSLGDLFSDYQVPFDPVSGLGALANFRESLPSKTTAKKQFFFNEDEKMAFRERHKTSPLFHPDLQPGKEFRVYLGIDAGSTTTKFVLLDEQENVVDCFYSNNSGDPLRIIKKAFIALDKKYREAGVNLKIIAAGTTGYGELLFARALGADFHTVETVAHAAAARKYVPGATFILDIGGQDMKAITIARNIVTDITLNEACSAGCGSFLENFALSLNIPVDKIAEAAFSSKNPAELGSRCTVFMNSCIINEQRSGKHAEDLMAGLCRSIIENVFTKVVRISNFTTLGDRIVAQGGAFKNDAVLRAFEQYIQKPVIRAPYPGEMGAIGIALLAKKHAESLPAPFVSRFIGLEAMKNFDYTQESNFVCTFCSNNCSRTLLRFSDGRIFVTGNRCMRGEIIGDSRDKGVHEKVRQLTEKIDAVPDLMLLREKLLFQDYPYVQVSPAKEITIGLPRVLEFWNSMPFWTTFWQSLGFRVRISRSSTRALFEKGLPFVASDTICFPAKLAHGHIQDLVEKKVDRIFMPMLVRMPSENTEPLSDYVCAVVKGYPLVIRYSDDPEQRWNTIYDAPMFHWFKTRDRNRQICDYVKTTFGIPPGITRLAIDEGDEALDSFRRALAGAGSQVLRDIERKNANPETGEKAFAVVLAGRPYHNDKEVNHGLSRYFTQMGIPVLTLDSLPGLNNVDLRFTRTEITNNFHARMLSGALIAGRRPCLEYVQIVNFGCGHDAILTDEVTRLLNNTSGKDPLILKLDESDVSGPLNIRIKSFIETVKTRRAGMGLNRIRELDDPYPVKFTRAEWKNKTLLIPNVSRAFSMVVGAAISRQGFKVECLPLGDREAMKLGKKYVHNDICFPAQMNIGEVLSVLEKGIYKSTDVVIGMGKYQCDCRLAQYTGLARRALDEAGFGHVPIVTTDKLDSKNMFPGFRLGLTFEMRVLWGLIIIDTLEYLRRKIRPYELDKGLTDRVFEEELQAVTGALGVKGVRSAIRAFARSIEAFRRIPYNRERPMPQVLITGEFLLNFHPGANFHVEEYLEEHSLEVIMPRITDIFWRNYIRMKSEMKDFHVTLPFADVIVAHVGDGLFDFAVSAIEKIAFRHPLFEASMRLPEMAALADPVMHRTFTSGEGYLIPGEIIHHARRGVRSFIILQPFGCIPNHISGRGVVKRLKEEFPHIQILALDYDPDVSFANIENRLQMLIMNAKEPAGRPLPVA